VNNHKATPQQWDKIEEWCSEMSSTDSCILELRARVMALEAQTNHSPDATKMVPPTVATDEELKQTWLQGATLTQGNRAIYDLGIEHGQARSREVAEPAPVAGEVEELVADLRAMATDASAAFQFDDAKILYRAANTLQRLSEQEAGR